MSERKTNFQHIVRLVLKAMAVGMAMTSMVFGYLGDISPDIQVNLLSLGLFTLAIAALQKKD